VQSGAVTGTLRRCADGLGFMPMLGQDRAVDGHRAADAGGIGVPPRVRNPWGQGARLRTEILRAASQLLSALGGEEGLTVRGVARAAGIAPASIYAHFADKNDLVRAVAVYEHEQLATCMRDAENLAGPEDTFGRLRAQVRAYCSFAIDNPSHYRLMVALRLEARRRHSHGPEAGSVIETITTALQRCEAAGLGLRLSPQRAAIMLFVSVHGRVALWHSNPEAGRLEDVHAFVDELLSLIIDPR
jgi:AcrR family transcriptional regulator